jgi:hypothetical protein
MKPNVATDTVEIKKGSWIYWRWRNHNGQTWSKDYVQDVVNVGDDAMIELTDYEFWTKYPLRVSLSEIEIKIEVKEHLQNKQP